MVFAADSRTGPPCRGVADQLPTSDRARGNPPSWPSALYSCLVRSPRGRSTSGDMPHSVLSTARHASWRVTFEEQLTAALGRFRLAADTLVFARALKVAALLLASSVWFVTRTSIRLSRPDGGHAQPFESPHSRSSDAPATGRRTADLLHRRSRTPVGHLAHRARTNVYATAASRRCTSESASWSRERRSTRCSPKPGHPS